MKGAQNDGVTLCDYTEGSVASSKLDSHCIACSRDSPHISDDGRRPPQ